MREAMQVGDLPEVVAETVLKAATAGSLVCVRKHDADPFSGKARCDRIAQAGHHTIAAALTWTLYLTSRAREWEARMLEEIRQVVPAGPVTGEHIDKLVTVQQVLTESLRLFPPLPVMSRYAAKDVELAGEHIKAGTRTTDLTLT